MYPLFVRFKCHIVDYSNCSSEEAKVGRIEFLTCVESKVGRFEAKVGRLCTALLVHFVQNAD